MNDVCTGCGEPNPPGTQFCLFCGIYLGWEDRSDDPGGRQPAHEPAAPRDEDITAPLSDPTAPLPLTPAAVQARGRAEPATGTSAVAAHAPLEAPAVTSGQACPSCGRPTAPGRRFCGHCGQVLGTGAPVVTAQPRRRGWWQRLLRSDTRRARKDYRRSLPPLYRWRRVGVTALLAVLVVGGLAVIGRDPVGWTVARWYDLTNRLEPVADVRAEATPPESVVRENAPQGLLDLDAATAWVTGWTPPEQPAGCGEGRGGRVVLTFPEARVRELRVITGVTNESDRPLQHIPTQLDVMLPDGTCRFVPLGRSPELQEVAFDTGVPVGRLTVSIGEAHTADDERVQDVAGLTQLTLMARPGGG